MNCAETLYNNTHLTVSTHPYPRLPAVVVLWALSTSKGWVTLSSVLCPNTTCVENLCFSEGWVLL